MKVEILRTPGLDLVHDLARRPDPPGPIEVPKDLTEGETRDLPGEVAEVLISCGVARAADKAPPPAKHKDEKHTPAK